MDKGQPMDPAEGKCNARNRKGSRCGRAAGWGTDHLGSGNCRQHGGNTPNGQTYAARQVGAQLAKNFGGLVEIEPHDALLQALYASAGATAWLRTKVEDLEEEVLHGPVGGTEHGNPREEPHVWIRLYADERDRLARTAKLCLDAGIAERQVRLAEQFGAMIAGMLGRVLEALGVADHPDAPSVVRRELASLESGRGEVLEQAA